MTVREGSEHKKLYLHCRKCVDERQEDKLAIHTTATGFKVECDSHNPPMLVAEIKGGTLEGNHPCECEFCN